MSDIVLPGSVIGVLGSGQLGRMFAIAARQMGYRVHVFSPDDDTPTGQVADVEIQADYADLDSVSEFARRVDVITFEFENVPVVTAEAAGRYAPMYPAGQVLHTTQNRLREKTFFRREGLPVTPFAPVRSLADVDQAVEICGLPAVLKSASWGYDGKGQRRVESREEICEALPSISSDGAVLERWVDLEAELSVVVARGRDGETACFAPISNIHRNHILDVSSTPVGVSSQVSTKAIDIAQIVVKKLEAVGVVCIEFFLTRDGELWINEVAPRPHNSGHLTIDAHMTSQFEQQVRAVCGLPLGSTEQLRPAAMVNLMGELWSDGDPPWQQALMSDSVKLHLYGKREARPHRKMGHLTVLSDTPESAVALAIESRRRLTRQTKEHDNTCGSQ